MWHHWHVAVLTSNTWPRMQFRRIKKWHMWLKRQLGGFKSWSWTKMEQYFEASGMYYYQAQHSILYYIRSNCTNLRSALLHSYASNQHIFFWLYVRMYSPARTGTWHWSSLCPMGVRICSISTSSMYGALNAMLGRLSQQSRAGLIFTLRFWNVTTVALPRCKGLKTVAKFRTWLRWAKPIVLRVLSIES